MKIQILVLLSFLGTINLCLAETFSTAGNTVTPLTNGHDLNQKRLELVRTAEKFIYLKTFIINRDPSEAPVFEALCERAKEGIDVRMLVDDIGRRQGGNAIKMKKGPFSIAWFKSCGVRFERYAKASWGPIDFALYNQHDKLLVSEKIGIMGGTNFSRDYSAHAQFSKQWYDFDVALTGPSVCSLQKVFTGSWRRAYNQEFVGIKRILGKKRRARIDAQFSPETLIEDCLNPQEVGINNISIIFNDPKFTKERPFVDYIIESLDIIEKNHPEMTVNLYAPYFVPNKKVLAKLASTAKTGVKIRIITNSSTSVDPEAFAAYAAMLMKVKPLLESGVEIHLWNPSSFKEQSNLDKDNVFHKKGGCFGVVACFIGSHNLDVRGDKFSSELMAVLTDEEIVSSRVASFENDLQFTVPLTLESRKQLLKDTKITQRIIARIAGWAL